MKEYLTSNLSLIASSIIHPLLLAVFPIIFLYAHNTSDVSVDQVLKPMLFSALAAATLVAAVESSAKERS